MLETTDAGMCPPSFRTASHLERGSRDWKNRELGQRGNAETAGFSIKGQLGKQELTQTQTQTQTQEQVQEQQQQQRQQREQRLT